MSTTIVDYASLQTAIINWAMRSGETDFATNVPDFIAAAEHLMNYGDGGDIPPLRTRDMEKTATITISSGAGSLPSDYLQYRTIYTQDATPILLKPSPPGYRIEQYGNASTGYAFYFDIIGSTINTASPADANLTIDYYAQIPALSNSQTTNWLLTKAPFVYLYGSLIAAAPYMMDDQRAQTWGILYQKYAKGLADADIASKYARSSVILSGSTP